MSSGRAVGRAVAGQVRKDVWRQWKFHDIQKQARSRPGSVQVETPYGRFWMSPIEAQLYDAMRRKGLSPIPQYCIAGYFVDFAFPDVNVAVEADGAAYHTSEEHRQRDLRRDYHIRRNGWKVMHFKGSTIYQKADNCACVIEQDVEKIRKHARILARKKKLKRKRQKEALLHPLRAILGYFKRKTKW